MKAAGFDPIVNWPSSYFNKRSQIKLMIYVDDFELAGPTENLKEGWSLICKSIDMDSPQPIGHFLGCMHEQFKEALPDGTEIDGMRYNAGISLDNAYNSMESCTSKKQDSAHSAQS